MLFQFLIFFQVDLFAFFGALHRQQDEQTSEKNLKDNAWKSDVYICTCDSTYESQRHHHVCHSIINWCAIRLFWVPLVKVKEESCKSYYHDGKRANSGSFFEFEREEPLNHGDGDSSSTHSRDCWDCHENRESDGSYDFYRPQGKEAISFATLSRFGVRTFVSFLILKFQSKVTHLCHHFIQLIFLNFWIWLALCFCQDSKQADN